MGNQIREEEEGSSKHQRQQWHLSRRAGPKPPPSAQPWHSTRAVLKPAHKSNHRGAKELWGFLFNGETIIPTASRVRFTILWHQTKEKRGYNPTEGKRSPPASPKIPWPSEILSWILLSDGVPTTTPTLKIPSTKMNQGRRKRKKRGSGQALSAPTSLSKPSVADGPDHRAVVFDLRVSAHQLSDKTNLGSEGSIQSILKLGHKPQQSGTNSPLRRLSDTAGALWIAHDKLKKGENTTLSRNDSGDRWPHGSWLQIRPKLDPSCRSRDRPEEGVVKSNL
ncbi:hypothetical protein U1Q18_032460 [Sarracenia purpurea var. burkii]